ncbi:MAG: TonB-dependent receptor plug domain-containing protein [Bacteroidota bacterium]
MQYPDRFLLFFTVVCLSGLLSESAFGQEAAFSGQLPDSVVVTASRLPEDARQTGRRVTVLTARDIETLPATSIDEVLRTMGGIEMQSRGGFGVQSDITMRGSSFDGVVLLLDGARINDPQTGHFLTNFPVPLSEIARIEVVRGPATSLYGPDAVGGVIHLFTWAGLREAGGPNSIALDAKIGRHDLYDTGLSVRLPVGSLGISAASTFQGSDGQPIYDAEGRPMQSSAGPVRTDFRRQAHSVAASGIVQGASLYARAGIDEREFGSWHFYTPFPSDTAYSDSRTLWAQARLRSANASAATRASIQLSSRFQESSYQYNPISTPNSHTNSTSMLQAEVQHVASPVLTIGTGITAGLRGINSNSMGTHSDAGGGAFVLARWQPLQRFTLNASTRLDYDAAYGSDVTPQLSVAYHASRTSFRAAVARAVRAPTYTERYYDTERTNPAGNLGNPDLRPERAWSYEAGTDLYVFGGSLHATVFHRSARDVIDYARLDAANPLFLARNIHRIRTNGVEFDAEIGRWIGELRLRASGSYTFLDSELDVPEGAQFKYALVHARHIAQGYSSVDYGRTSLGVQVMWKQPMEGDAFAVTNLRGRLSLPFAAERLSVTAELRNAFDRAYSEVFDAPMPGRWWVFGLRLAH